MATVVLPHEREAEGIREVSVTMTKARAKALVRELLSAYAGKTFQTKLMDILSKEELDGTPITDELPSRWAWAEKFHNDILAQYGFATGHGMGTLTQPLELILKSCPECMSSVQKIGEFLKLKNWPVQSADAKPEETTSKAHSDGATAKPVALSKPRALALQTELLAILSTPSFQKKLGEMSRQRQPLDTFKDHKDVIYKLFDNDNMETIARYGFDISEQGVEDMFNALEKLQDDPDVFVNAFAIEEALLTFEKNPGPCALSSKKVPISGVLVVKPKTKFIVAKLLRKQLAGFSTPSFQHAVAKLKKKANVEQACDGYYHLTGRAELALTVQRRILPTFGFAASRAGVLDMVLHCTRFLSDDEIAHLWDDINMKLGMTPDACRRFRESAAGFKSHRSSEIGQVAMEENSRV